MHEWMNDWASSIFAFCPYLARLPHHVLSGLESKGHTSPGYTVPTALSGFTIKTCISTLGVWKLQTIFSPPGVRWASRKKKGTFCSLVASAWAAPLSPLTLQTPEGIATAPFPRLCNRNLVQDSRAEWEWDSCSYNERAAAQRGNENTVPCCSRWKWQGRSRRSG